MSTLYVIAGLSIVPLIIYGYYTHYKTVKLFQKYSKEPLKKGITGSRLARNMLNSAGLTNIVIEEISQELGDHYDPKHKVIRLSRKVARNSSISAIGIAAHEAAHALQDNSGYALAKLRNNVAPIIEKVAYLFLPFLFLGIIAGKTLFSSFFLNIAVFIFLGITTFYIITLPLELEASSRALRYIEEKEIADKKELGSIKEILRAAAMTYVVAAALAISQFLRLLGMFRSK